MYKDLEQRLDHLMQRLQFYNAYEVLFELMIIWLVVYVIFRFLRGTRGARAAIGVLVLFGLFTLLGQLFGFRRLDHLYGKFMTLAAFALVIVFQPELRRALVRLGETRWLAGGGLRKARAIEEVLSAVAYLSKNKVGALIAIERQVGLKGIIEAGTRLDAQVSRDLLNTIFWPGSALHDMGVVIQGDRIVAASVQFPLAEGEQYGTELGSRHRSAIGLSNEADALVIVVSEETGRISLAERGKLTRDLTIDTLRTYLVRGLGKTDLKPPQPEQEDEDPDEHAAAA